MDKQAAGCSSQAKRETHFFKIVQPHNLEEGTLEIPPEFVNKYGKCLKRHVFLEVPKGAVQKVGLKRSDGRVWLHKGWQDFVDHYSINCWYFLVFRHEGNSFFRVLIFDPSCSEIEYTVNEDDDGDDVVEIPDRIGARDGALERAKAFQSPNPHFIVQMRPAYIYSCYMHVPGSDARNYFYGRDNKGLHFIGPDGKRWLLKYYIMEQSQVRLGSGWKEFVRGYDLQAGDACVFELLDISSTVMEFNITIFRVDG